MKRTNIFAALGCALLVFSLVGCGSTNKLQSITLTASLIDGVPPSTQTGIYNLNGDSSTIQLQAMGEYSNSKSVDLTNKVTYTVVVDPNYNQGYLHGVLGTLIPPCQAPSSPSAPPCPDPSSPPFTSGTVEYSQTGLITAVEPAVCTWEQSGSFFIGAYEVTASLDGVTSQPVIIPVASEAGPWAGGACGPTS
ncbi:MAG: hypothetical protein WAL71_06570 [Terriglobales bacterium]